MKVSTDSSHRSDARVDQRPVSLPKKKEDKSCHSITINKPPSEVYAFCENKNNLDALIKKLKVGFNCDVTLVKDEINRSLNWFSTEQSEIKTTGHVWFITAAQDLGTVVTLVTDYSMPGGVLTELLAKFKGEDVDTLILTNLKRIKCYLETGEVATVEGQSSGREEDQQKMYIH